MKKIMFVLALAAISLHNCYAEPADWTDTGKYGKNIKFLSDYLEDFKEMRGRHPLYPIHFKYIYNENDVNLAWNEKWKDFTKNVVRINSVEETDDGVFLPMIGTGTLIDVGDDKLKGRVVITCAHCVVNHQAIHIPSDQEGHLILKTGIGDFFPKCGDLLTNNAYISVTPEPKQYNGNLPLINTKGNTRVAKYKVKRSYIYRVGGRMFDLAILILDKPVMDENNQILSGEKISADGIFGYKKREEVTQNDNNFYVIGYGITGVSEGQSPSGIGSLLEAVKDGQLKKRQDLLQLLGWNKKKCIWVDYRYVPDKMINKYGTFQDLNRAGIGFSGSLVVKETNAGLKYVGIYSGPMFRLPSEKIELDEAKTKEPEYMTLSDSADICEFINFVKDEEFRQP
ncbi:MAG: hypothetical protein LBJ71_01585 [Holosporaceae bacterium]|jgi:hypothetical protein|nr:hypothetical protein [Holosporaceae bacterium]